MKELTNVQRFFAFIRRWHGDGGGLVAVSDFVIVERCDFADPDFVDPEKVSTCSRKKIIE
jgi:hypothetical protein